MSNDDDPATGNIEFSHAVFEASKAIAKAAADLRAAERTGETARLLNYLRSEKALTAVDRLLLVDLLSGELARQPGRANRPMHERAQRQEAHHRYKLAMAQRPRPNRFDVANRIAADLGITPDLVLAVAKDRKMRI